MNHSAEPDKIQWREQEKQAVSHANIKVYK